MRPHFNGSLATHPKGSLVEVFSLNKSEMGQVYQQGNIQAFVLNEGISDYLLDWPYYRILTKKNSDTIHKEGLNFQGYILRGQDRNLLEQAKALTSHQREALTGIELEVTRFRIAKSVTEEILKELRVPVLFVPGQKCPISDFNKLLKHIKSLDPLYVEKLILSPYDLNTNEFNDWVQLECFQKPTFQQGGGLAQYSIIMPHFENSFFLCNALEHLANIDNSERIEVLVVDDGSSRKSLEYIKYFIEKNVPRLNVQIFEWPLAKKFQDGTKIFRAGASRNWGASYATTNQLLFLDCDMLVPNNLCAILESAFNKSDVTQFVRHHIKTEKSNESVRYHDLKNEDLYIEEAKYWNQLFQSKDWMQIPDYWKFTCTYALAVKKSDFNEVGRIRRNFIRYGFEDTDLGYRLAKAKKSFRLESTPFYHLTSQKENTNSWSFKYRKMQRIRPMARVFYELNQDPSIFESFRSFLA